MKKGKENKLKWKSNVTVSPLQWGSSAGVLAEPTGFLPNVYEEARHSRVSPLKKEGKYMCPAPSQVPLVKFPFTRNWLHLVVSSGSFVAAPNSISEGMSFHWSLKEKECPSKVGHPPRGRKKMIVKGIWADTWVHGHVYYNHGSIQRKSLSKCPEKYA